MKRALAILLAAITALLCACGGGAAVPETTAAPTTAPTTEATTEPTVPAEDILAEAEALLFPGSLEIIPDGEAAMVLALPLAEDGNAHAQYLVGYIYDYAVDVEQDYEEAIKWYTLSADQGYPRAMVGLFFIYYYGQGVEADEEKAQELVQRALNLGYVEANYALGTICEEKGEYEEAIAYYQIALEGSDPEYVGVCYFIIGIYYDRGYGEAKPEEPDYQKALECYQNAADMGQTGAACNIANLYENGLGVEEDKAESNRWLQIGDSREDSCSLYIDGYKYYIGEGGEGGNELDYEKAMERFLRSVEANNSEGAAYSMECIGWLYEDGLGVEQDYQAATDWYKKAVEAGNEYAEEGLARMKSKGYS